MFTQDSNWKNTLITTLQAPRNDQTYLSNKFKTIVSVASPNDYFAIRSPPRFITAFIPKHSSMHSMSRRSETDRPLPILYTRQGAELDHKFGEMGSHLASGWQFTHRLSDKSKMIIRWHYVCVFMSYNLLTFIWNSYQIAMINLLCYIILPLVRNTRNWQMTPLTPLAAIKPELICFSES